MDILPIPEARVRVASQATELWNNCLTGGAIQEVFTIHSDMTNNIVTQSEMIKTYDGLYGGDTFNGIEKRIRGPDAINIRHPRLAAKPRPFGSEDDDDEEDDLDLEDNTALKVGNTEPSKSSEDNDDETEDSKEGEDFGEYVKNSTTQQPSGDESEADDASSGSSEEESNKVKNGKGHSEDEDSDDEDREDEDSEDEESEDKESGDDELEQQPLGTKSPCKSPARKKARADGMGESEQVAGWIPKSRGGTTMKSMKTRSKGKPSLEGLPKGMK